MFLDLSALPSPLPHTHSWMSRGPFPQVLLETLSRMTVLYELLDVLFVESFQRRWNLELLR